jgi:hypothetical protein
VELVNPDYWVWLDWMLENDTKVEHTVMDSDEYVDTQFTGMLREDGTCYQTCVLGGLWHGAFRAYKTKEEAQAGHSQMVNWLLNGGKNEDGSNAII